MQLSKSEKEILKTALMCRKKQVAFDANLYNRGLMVTKRTEKYSKEKAKIERLLERLEE